MGLYYKATRLDGTDFRTGTVDYAAICGTGETLRPLPGGPCCTWLVYHASTIPHGTLIGGEWPCRLFEIEGEPCSQEDDKRGFRTMAVVREIEPWQALGPNGKAVDTIIDRCASLTASDFEGLTRAWDATWLTARITAQNEVWTAAWTAARHAAWGATRNAFWNSSWSATGNSARDAAWDAVTALLVKDLISEWDFEILYSPWRSVIGE